MASSMTQANPVTYKHNALLAIPFMLLVPVAYGLAFHLWGITLNWSAIGAGAVGWLVALMLRAPVGLVARRILHDPLRVQPWIVAASGPCEEIMRLIILLLIGRTFPLAISIGLGWTAIEIVYTCINGLALSSLLTRTDEKAQQARALLSAMGLDKALTSSAPGLGVIERISVSALHIGFTLLLAWQPLVILLTIPLHSASNFVWLRLTRRSPVLTEVCVAIEGAALFLLGLALFGKL